MTTVDAERLVPACALADLERDGKRVTNAGGRAILLVHDRGTVRALDNRCPHMGFPLHRGTVRDGILTCHWHHAKFEVGSGCTFDLFADDVPTFRVEVRDGTVWVDPSPPAFDRRAHWLGRLDAGLEHAVSLVLAKSAIALAETGATHDALRRAALFAVRNRRSGWGAGLTILTAAGSLLDVIDADDRPLALFHGLVHAAASTAGQARASEIEPLRLEDVASERLDPWFRRFVEVRQEQAAARVLATAVRSGEPADRVAAMVFAACTDHLFLDTGHTLDFANKAFELLEIVGWDAADDVLPSLVPGLVGARRMEEAASWRDPVDVAAMVGDAARELPSDLPEAAADWSGHADLAEEVLDGEPAHFLGRLVTLVGDGVPPRELSAAIAYAAALRAVRFPTSNDVGDWETVHHAFTYANAVDRAVRRTPSALITRALLDAAVAVWLERFLNVPSRPLPIAAGPVPPASELLRVFDSHGGVDEAGQVTAAVLAGGDEAAAVRVLGHALLREDAGFHQFQMYEAGVRQWSNFRGRPEGRHVLVGVARYLAAHFPTVRARGQTFDIARRLQRGDPVHLDAD